MYSTSRLRLVILIIVTSMSPSALSNQLDWHIEIRQFTADFSPGPSVQRSATFAPSSDIPTMSSAVIQSSFPARSSFDPTSAPPSSIASEPQTSAPAEPTSAAPEPTSDPIPSQTQAPSGNTGGGATTSQGSPTTSAGGSQSTGGGIVNGLGTTRSGGTLIVATTDADGRTTTLRGADASRATSVHIYTSALLGTSQRPLTYRTTRVVDGSTSIGEFTTSRPVTVTTGTATATNPAELNAGNDSGSGGLDAGDRKIVGGVVGGIGGALLIGFIIIALLRYRKKKNKRLSDDDYDDNDYSAENKRISRRSTQVLGDGLERYHNPASPSTAPAMSVNHSSNF